MLTRVSLFFALALVLHAANPNIIYILADDQGYGDVGAFNPESKIATPNLDRLAGDGMRFTDAHSSSSVCTPTRYSVLTGRYHWRTRLQSGVLGGFSKHLIAPERMTVASLLRENGYATACIGKWHLGMDWPLKAGGFANTGNADGDTIDFAGRIVNGPIANGFDYFFGISASLDMPPYLYIENDRATAIPNEQMSRGRKGPKHSDFTLEGVLPDVTAKTVEVIGQRAKKDKPFFIYMPLNAPHTPIVPVAEFAGKSGINRYADFVMQIDHSVGQVMAALDAHKIAENTLIIFTTDNGCSPAARIPELQAKGHEPSYIYRGHKADIFEGGHRVPFIARWPAKVAAGSSSDALVG
ncbi:MAG: arylsulfatase A, partial [Rhodothermales bacterium]